MNNKLKEKCRQIKIVLTDVDGVLTDGGMYYSNKGDVMKKFHTRDGMGVTLLLRKNIHTMIITKEKTSIVRKWAKKMRVKKLYDGILQKETMVDIICKQFKVKPSQLAYIGDDVNDLELLNKVGFSASPADAIEEVKNTCDYICKVNGGRGAFREIADMILKSIKSSK